MKLNKENLEKLRDYFINDGSQEYKDVAAFLNVDPKNKKEIDEAIAQLKEAFPNLTGSSKATVAPTPVKEASTPTGNVVPTGVNKVILMDSSTGIGRELKIVAQKGTKLVVEEIVPKDLVTVKIGGNDVEIDLLALGKMKATDTLHGVSVQTLKVLGAIAKGE